jgi:hypothetical protein
MAWFFLLGSMAVWSMGQRANISKQEFDEAIGSLTSNTRKAG